MANNEKDDKELDDYLNTDSELSKAYRVLNNAEPASDLDNKILSAAKEVVEGSNTRIKEKTKQKFHQSPWVMPVSVAAMITLSVSLVVTMQQETGQSLISESEVEMFDAAVKEEKLSVSESMQSSDGVVINEVEIKQKKDVRVDESAAAPLDAVGNMQHADQKLESAKARMKEAPAKRILLKENIPMRADSLEERAVLEDIVPAAPTGIEFDDTMIAAQDNEQIIEEDVLLNIKTLWENGEFEEAKQVYEEFLENYSDSDLDRIKKILGVNIYNGLQN